RICRSIANSSAATRRSQSRPTCDTALRPTNPCSIDLTDGGTQRALGLRNLLPHGHVALRSYAGRRGHRQRRGKAKGHNRFPTASFLRPKEGGGEGVGSVACMA